MVSLSCQCELVIGTFGLRNIDHTFIPSAYCQSRKETITLSSNGKIVPFQVPPHFDKPSSLLITFL